MILAESIRIAIRTLLANKARTSLTMLGIAIGVASVILLLALGVGVQEEIGRQIEGLGSNLLFVFPGQITQGPRGSFGGLNRRFDLDDVRYLRGRLTGVDAVVPVLQSTAVLRKGNRTIRTAVAASESDAQDVFTAELEAGRHYRESEVSGAERVCALAATPRRELFPNTDPLGETITVNGQRFTVVGYYRAQGGGLTGNLDNQVYMPATTAMRLFGRDDIDYIVARVSEPDRIDEVHREIERIMRPVFGDQFTVFSQEQTLGVLIDVLGTLTAMLGGIAAISLLVGGVGIMNILLVSVIERTPEIGIRKAVGARERDILAQFVAEAVLLSALGGLQGIVVGVGGALAASRFIPMRVTWWAALLAFTFAAAVGIGFGVYPAWKASRLDPVEALRRA